jgi:hypothetical protein
MQNRASRPRRSARIAFTGGTDLLVYRKRDAWRRELWHAFSGDSICQTLVSAPVRPTGGNGRVFTANGGVPVGRIDGERQL